VAHDRAVTAPPLSPAARAVVDRLGLAPHPEGGFYRETSRAPAAVGARGRPARAASTAIYFLLPEGAISALHRVASDEVWHHYDGVAIDLHTIDEAGVHGVARLGRDLAAGERPQLVVPAGVWQAAVPVGGPYVLVGCTVAPGFDFADFELPPRAELEARFPALAGVVRALGRP
jgi:predicted cupin superfamily sugar epimerase